MSVAERLASDVHSLEQQAHGTVAAAAAWAEEVHLTLHEIRHNTSQLFFWTAFLGAVCATTALLYAVNRLRDQLEQLNRHQVAYRDMWAAERDRMQGEARRATGVKESILNRMTNDWDKVEHAKFGLMRDLVARAGQSEALLEELVAGGARPVPRRSPGLADHDALLDRLERERRSYPSPPGPDAARAPASGYPGHMDGGRDGVRGANGGMPEAPGERGEARSASLASVDSIEQDFIEEMDM